MAFCEHCNERRAAVSGQLSNCYLLAKKKNSALMNSLQL